MFLCKSIVTEYKPGSLTKSRVIDTNFTMVSTLLALSHFFALDEPFQGSQISYSLS